MESKKINQLATELTPALSDLTIIGDPSTGVSRKITLSQMASLFTGTVEEYANFAAFPLVGVADTIYIALDTNIIYRWNTGTSAYVELSPNIVSSLIFNDANGFDGTINLVGSVATLTITTALTTGSVPFIGASGALSQDNSNLFFDDTNNRLGINTNSPTTALDVFGSGIIGRVNGTSTNNAFLGFASAGTNKWSIGNVQSDHRFRIYNEATTSELVSLLETGEFGIGIANPTTKLHIDGGASALIANLDANVSVAKSLSFRSDNSNRINLEVSGTESGSNAGANFFIRRYSDAGSLIDTPLTITRSTGAITLATALSGTSANFSSSISSTEGIFSSSGIDGSFGSVVRISTTDTNGNARNWALVNTFESYGDLNFRVSTAQGGNALTAGSTIMTLNRSGNVGIGTSTIGAKLHVSGTVEANGSLYRAVFGTTVQDSDLGGISGGNGSEVQIQSPSTTRGAFLTLGGGMAFDEALGGIAFYNSNNVDGKRNRAFIVGGQAGATAGEQGSYLSFGTVANTISVPSERIRIASNGNVGIGTSSPVAIGGGYTAVDIQGSNGGGFNFGPSTAKSFLYADSGGGYLGTSYNAPFIFYANGTERMRIGNVNTRNAEIDLKGNVIQSFVGSGGTLSAGATYSTTITQIQFEWETSYIVDASGLYAPGGANIQAFSTAIIHLFNDGNTHSTFVHTITSTGLSISATSNTSGTFNIIVTNTAGSSMSNNNIRILKINRMN
jgi:hypothetical protein